MYLARDGDFCWCFLGIEGKIFMLLDMGMYDFLPVLIGGSDMFRFSSDVGTMLVEVFVQISEKFLLQP